MDRRLVKFIVISVAGTFILLSIAVAFKVSSNERKRGIREQFSEIDQRILRGEYRNATSRLSAISTGDLSDDLKVDFNERVDDVITAIENLVEQDRVDEVVAIIGILNRLSLTPIQKEAVNAWSSQLEEEIRYVEMESTLERNRILADSDVQRQQDRRLKSDTKRAKRLEKELRLKQVGGAFLGMVYAFGLIVFACILIGLGQLIVAFRDVAINSYLTAPRDSGKTTRTLAPIGQTAPRYRFIPVVAGVFYTAAAIEILLAIGLVVFIVINLFN